MSGVTNDEATDLGQSSLATTVSRALDRSSGFLLTLAGALIVFSALLFLLQTWTWHLAGYVLAAPAPFALVLKHRRDAIRRREEDGIVESTSGEVIAWMLLGTGFAIALLHGFAFAYEVARL